MMLIIEITCGLLIAFATLLAFSYPEAFWEIVVSIPSMTYKILKAIYNKDGGIWFSIICFGIFSLSLLLFPGLAHWLYLF
jgi:hypothetical protein